MVFTAKILLLGSGELGKEFVISAKRYGCYVVACDSYADAPAMQVADEAEVFSMLDAESLRQVIEKHKPDLIVPEVEAIRTEVLQEFEDKGFTVVPSPTCAVTAKKVIVEEFIAFEYEITLLTIRSREGISYCEPIGHRQERGDYQESWQPTPMTQKLLADAREMARKVVDNLGGYGIFGVEFFVTKDEVIFSELSPRPHDTGLVTLLSQNLSEFDLHARAMLGLPIPHIRLNGPTASAVILADREAERFSIEGLKDALAIGSDENDVEVRIFGKPTTRPYRRMGVALASGKSVEEARERARQAAAQIQIKYNK